MLKPSAFSLQPEFFSKKKILISGGTGYLASGIIALLKDVDCRITRLGRSEEGRAEVKGAARITELTGDIRDPAVWKRSLDGVDILLHLAAQTSTYVANADPLADHAINVLPMLQLLECCRQSGLRPTVVFASTVTVAGIQKHLPVNESHPDHPLTVYDLHKQMAEKYLRWYSEQGFVRGVALRLSNVYGPGAQSSSADRGILNQMIRRALAGEALTVYGTGKQLRDYLYIEDAARAFLAAAASAEVLNGNFFVIGSGVGRTIVEAMETVAERCALRTGRKVAVVHVDPPVALSPIEHRHFVADFGRFHQATGWAPRTPFVEGVDQTLETFL